jgi:urease accessory protein
MAVRMGRKVAELGMTVAHTPMLGRWLADVIDRQAPGTYAVGLGVLFADVGSPEQDAFAVHQYGLAMTTLSAALRLLRIKPFDVQAILHEVNAATAQLYAEVREATLGDMAGFAPQADILAAIHVRAHIRIFMT